MPPVPPVPTSLPEGHFTELIETAICICNMQDERSLMCKLFSDTKGTVREETFAFFAIFAERKEASETR